MITKKQLFLIVFFVCFTYTLYGKSFEGRSDYFFRNNSSTVVYFSVDFLIDNFRSSPCNEVVWLNVPDNPEFSGLRLRIGNLESGKNKLQPGSEVHLFGLSIRNSSIPEGVLSAFRMVISRFTVYDYAGNEIMNMCDLQEGVVIASNWEGSRIINDREGNITTEYIWPFREVHTIEITDEY